MSIFIYPPLSVSVAPTVGAATSANQVLEIAQLTAINTNTDGIETLVGSSNTKLDTLHTDIGVGNTSLSSIDGKQTTANTSLSSIDTKLTNNATTTLQTAGNTSLASIDTKLSGNIKTTTLDGSGNSIASIADGNGGFALETAFGATNFVVSSVNSSVAQLAAAATFTGTIETIFNQQAISVLLTTDQAGTLTLNQYVDLAGTRKISAWPYSISAGVPFSRAFTGNGNYFNLVFQNTGGSTTTTLNINTAYGTLPATTNLGNANVSLDEMGGTALSVGQKSAAASIPVTLSNENVLDMSVTGQSAQTATVNNILTAAAGATATDLSGYRSAMVQVVSTGTAGTFIFEGSNDNVNFIAIPVYNQLILTGTPITAAITATASQIGYVFATNFRYVRLRIATTITGGSIQAFSKFSQSPFTPAVFTVSQATAANLNTTVAGTVTVGTITAGANVIGNVGVGVVSVVDQASAALTTTTTGAAKLITNGASVSLTVNATVVSGTTPTYDFKIQESNDGTTWTDVWAAQRLAAVSSLTTPAIRIRGNQYRYVETVSGTTPSFTRTITSARIPHAGELIRNIVDRTIAPITTNSVTPSLYAEGCSFITMTVAQGAGGTAVVFAIDGSMDGTNWVQGIKTLTGVVSGFVSGSVSASFKFLRARVVTGVAATTITYLELEAKETPVDVSVNQNGSSSGTIVLTGASPTPLTAPAGAVGFILQNDPVSTVNIRFRTSGIATTSSGFQLAPGQDSGYIIGAPALSLIAVSGTTSASYNLEWILK